MLLSHGDELGNLGSLTIIVEDTAAPIPPVWQLNLTFKFPKLISLSLESVSSLFRHDPTEFRTEIFEYPSTISSM